MSSFLYYIANKNVMNRKTMFEYGLGYALEKKGEPTFTSMLKGPDKGAGVVFNVAGVSGNQSRLQSAGDFVWTKSPVSEYWVGFDKASPPEPVDLTRKKMYDGHLVELGDENEWLVPVARMVDGNTVFPKAMGWDGKNWKPGKVKIQYRELFKQACVIWEKIKDSIDTDSETSFTITSECDIGVQALACNYRLSSLEISTLGLFDSDVQQDVFKALIDWPTLEEWLKKNNE